MAAGALPVSFRLPAACGAALPTRSCPLLPPLSHCSLAWVTSQLSATARPCRLVEVAAASLARWADTYLMPEEAPGSPTLAAAFGAGSPGGGQAAQMLVSLALAGLTGYPGERALHEVGVSCCRWIDGVLVMVALTSGGRGPCACSCHCSVPAGSLMVQQSIAAWSAPTWVSARFPHPNHPHRWCAASCCTLWSAALLCALRC